MINTQDQEELFTLIANYLEEDLTCVAIGGTAMMFMKYKNTTKDIDLVFNSEEERKQFITAIEQLGYKEKALGNIYSQQQKNHEGKPQMFTRGDERFDLFVKTVFGYEISTKEFVQRRDYLGEKELTIQILDKEELVLLKAITNREKDYEDIETILEIEKTLDWDSLIEKAIAQKNNNEWILIDLEATLQKLKKKTFIANKHFKRIYEEQE